jgi:hypothetical protein
MPGSGLGQRDGIGRDQAEKADAHPAHLAQRGCPEHGQRRLGFDVGRQPGKARLGEALARHLRPEVELVVARHGEVEAHRIPGAHHLRPLEQAGLDAGRKRVAAEDEERGRMPAAQGLDQPRQPRQAATRRLGIDRRDLVDVIHMDDADLDVGGAVLRITSDDEPGQEDQGITKKNGGRWHGRKILR